MNLNVTLFGQMITFAIFVWFTMKFVWPHIKSAMDERQKKIAEGLTAAERAHHELQLAQHRVTEQLRDAKIKSTEIIDGANHRAEQIIEDAKNKARHEGQRLLALAQNEIQQESIRVRQELRKEAVNLAIIGAEKILQNRLDKKVHSEMVNQLIAEMQE